MKLWAQLLQRCRSIVFLLASGCSVFGQTVPYFTDFESGIGPEWSSSALAGSAASPFTQFTGRFGNSSQTLTLTGLTPGQSYTVSFDFYAIDSWDGNGDGPDFFNVAVDGTQLFHYTFSNYNGDPPQQPQSYPYQPDSGRVDLGFSSFVDAIYRNIEIQFTPAAATTQISFSGQNLEALDNESWGIDNVRVLLTSTVPATSITSTTLPAANSSSAIGIDRFSITASRQLTANTANTATNFSLVSAGANGTFGDSDDVAYTLVPTWNGGKRIDFVVSDGPLQPGLYRFATKAGLQDFNNQPVTAFTRDFSMANPVLGRIENQANNVLEQATPLPMTETPASSGFLTALGVGTFSAPGDVDYWRFDAEGGDRITVRLEADSTGVYPFIEIRNSADQGVTSAGGTFEGVAEIQNYSIPTPGTWYIRVSTGNKAAGYSLRVDQSRQAQFEVEPNDTQANANTLNLTFLPGSFQGYVAGTLVSTDAAGDLFGLGTLNVGNSISVSLVLPASSSLVPSDITLSAELAGGATALAQQNNGSLNYTVADNGVHFVRVKSAKLGIRSQYLVRIQVTDGVAPLITSVSLPAEGSTTTDITDHFQLTFSEDLDPSTVTNAATFDLRAAGPDNQFDTADDQLYPVLNNTYTSGLTANCLIGKGPLQPGLYRFTVKTSLKDRAGNSLAAAFVRSFSVANLPGIQVENRSNDTPATASTLSAAPSTAPNGSFAGFATFSAGSNPYFITSGRINSDAILDTAVANFSSGTVTVFLGNGDGTFQSMPPITVGSGPIALALGDLNGDGKADLVVANYNVNTLSILLGNGDGTFQSPATVTVANNPRSIALGDFNGDGKLDIAVANRGSGNISILVGNGDGTFAPAVNYSVQNAPNGIAAGDLNADGKLDLIVANEGSSTVSVLLNHGDGTFAAAVNIAAPGGPRSVAISDLNADGKPDAAVLCAANSTVLVFRGNGDGTFAAPAVYDTGSSDAYQVLLSDVSGDGKPDILIAGYGSSVVGALINAGDGSFGGVANYVVGGNPISVTTGDFNGDGRVDFATANYGGNSMSVSLGGRTEPLTADTHVTGLKVGSGRGTLSNNNDADYWSFTGHAGDLMTLAVETEGSAPNGSSLHYRVFRPDGNLLTEFYSNTSGWGQSATIPLPLDGNYTVLVTQNQVYSNEYRIRVTTAPPGLQVESEDNNQISQADGVTYNRSGHHLTASALGYISVGDGSGDFYNLGAVAPNTTISLNFTEPDTSHLAPAVILYDAAGHVAASSAAGASSLSFTTGSTSQNYFAQVYSLGPRRLAANATSLQFDGNTSFIDAGAWTPGSQWTVEAWVRPASLPGGRHTIVGSFNSCLDWGISMVNGELGVDVKPPGGCAQHIGSGIFPVPGTWYHVVGTSDGATAKIYINGVLKNSGPVESNYVGNSTGVRIGNEVCCGNDGFPGLIEEVRVWNRPLAAAEVVTDMSQILTGSESGLIGYWRLNEGTGSTVTDLTSQHHNGTITQAQWVSVGPVDAHLAGLLEQYVLNIDLFDTSPPTVTGIDLPAEGTTTTSIVDHFTVLFSEEIDPIINRLNPQIYRFNGHVYLLTDPLTWSAAETAAQAFGGHLVTINSAAENDFIQRTFAGPLGSVWIGFTDQASEGTFVWTSGQPATYTNWNPGEPNNSNNEDYAVMLQGGTWNDTNGANTLRGVIEIETADTDGDGLPDGLDPFPNDPLNGIDLRAAGPDGTFNTADDQVYKIGSAGYSGGLNATFNVVDGPLQPGQYRLTLTTSLTDKSGNPLSAPVVRNFTVAPVAGFPIESRNNNVPLTATTLSAAPSTTPDGSWTAAVALPSGSNPYSIAAGMLNGDTVLDLAVANYSSGTVSVFLGNGDGTFQPAQNFAAGTAPIAVAMGDFNGDGKTDIVAANNNGTGLSLLAGNGDGTFQTARFINLTSNNPRAIAVADFDGDGKLDIAVANRGSANVSVLRTIGDGTFGLVNFPVQSSPSGIAAGDLNGDGKPDLVIANEGSGSISVLLNTGTGSIPFATTTNFTVGTNPRSVAIGDITGDGKPDVVVLNAGQNTITVLPGLGNGTFAAGQNYDTGGSDPYQVAIADLNGDGKPDVLVANYGSSQVSVFFNKGDGTLKAAINYTTSGNPISIVPGDFNSDGRMDFATANYGSGTMSVYFGNPTELLTQDSNITGLRVGTGRGNLSNNSDVDYWSFTGHAGDALAVAVETPGNPGSSSLHYRVFRPDGYTLLDFYSNGNGWGQSPPATLPLDGTYTLLVSLNNAFTGEYRFRVTTAPGTVQLETEDNNTTAQADALVLAAANHHHTAQALGYISVGDSSGDFFNLGNLAEGNHIQLDLSKPATSHLAGLLQIYSPAGTVVATSAVGTPSLGFSVPTGGTGTYFAQVSSLGPQRPGGNSHSLQFDGNNNFIDVGAWSPGTQWTVEAWVRPSSLPGGRHSIVGGFNNCADWGISIVNGELGVEIKPPGGCSQHIGSGVFPVPGTWYHVVGTSDGATAKIYINGELKNSGPVEPNYIATNSGVRIGNEVCCGSDGFPGLIEEVRVWNRPLTGAEVVTDMNQALTGTEAGLIGYWHLNDGTGATVTDLTSQHHDGTISQAQWVSVGPVDAHLAGLLEQYLLNIDIQDTLDTIPPTITSIDLPAEASTSTRIIDRFAVQFSEEMDPAFNKLSPSVVRYNGHVYLMTDSAMTWTAAESLAQSLGGHLVTINDAAENEFVRRTFAAPANGVWIGFTDQVNEGTFLWASGQPPAYTNWNPGEPNNSGNEDYAMMYATGTWNDNNATTTWRAVMEFDGADTDGDGLPDGLDPYPNDPLNGFDLRAAGPDGTFNTADDQVYKIGSAGYTGGLTANFNILDGPLQPGDYRLTITTSLTDKAGNPLTAPVVRHFTVAPVPGFPIESRNNNSPLNATTLSLAPSPSPDGSWTTAFTAAAGSNPYFVVSGNFNNDSFLDVALANYSSGTVSIFLNNGDGTFQLPKDFAAGSGPIALALADFNGDGRVDLVAADYNSLVLSLLLGNGDGTFQTATTLNVGSNPRSIVVGDFNGDGKLDLAVANRGSANVSVLLGNGNGTFAAAVNYPVQNAPNGIAAGDLNNDGKLDLVAANEGSSTVSVLLNQGNGTFATASNISVGANPRSVAIGDINGDGKADLAVLNAGHNTISILPGLGNGTFSPAVTYPTGGSDPYQIIITDLNNDNKLDVAVANYGSSQVTVFFNKGDGTLQNAIGYNVSGNPISIAAADYNADGRIDFATANYGASSMSVLLGNATEPLSNDAHVPGLHIGTGRGNLSNNNDSDYWSFTGKAGDKFAIAAETPGNPGGSSLHYRVFRPDGNVLLDFYTSNEGWGQAQPAILPLDGTYTVLVTINQAYYGEYRFRVTMAPPTTQLESETNDAISQADPLTFALNAHHETAEVLGYISVADNSGDFYNLGFLPAGTDVALSIGQPDNSGFPALVRVYNQTGQVMAASEIGGSDLQFTVPPGLDGTYYARVNSDNSGPAKQFAGVNGFALRLDGQGDYVTIPDSSFVRPTSLTAEGWFKFTSTSPAVLIAKPLGSGTLDSYAIWYENGTLHGAISDLNGFGTILNFSWNADPGVWHHIAYTFDDAANTQTLYLDGAVVATSAIATSISYDTHPLRIGADIDNETPDAFFNGELDEVRLWNVARTAAQISADKDHLLAGTESGLVGYWRFDEGSGGTSADQTGHSQAALVNFPLWVSSTLSHSLAPGILAQYVLDIDMLSTQVPAVQSVSLPPNDSASQNIIDRFTLTLNEDLDPKFNQLNRPIGLLGGHAYFITDNVRSWPDAENDARQLGGHLAAVNNIAENNFIQQQFAKNENVWIGLTDAAIEGTFVWASNDPLSFTNWAPGEPNDSGKADFVILNTNGQWQDVPITSQYRGVIEVAGADSDGDGIPDSADLYPSDRLNAFDLRSAGPDGQFDTADDQVYRLLTANYTGGSTISFTVSDGPLQPGLYRFTVTPSLTDRFGNPLAAPFVRTFTVAPLPGFVQESRHNDTPALAGSLSTAPLETPDGSFTSGAANPAGANPYFIVSGRLDADANLDAITANYSSGTISVFRGNPDGTFQPAQNFAAGSGPISLALGDFNADGKLDVVATDYNASNVSILLGNGDGSFQAATSFTVGNNPRSVVVADFNGDGKLDLAVANRGSGNISVLLGNGNGTFATAVNYPTQNAPNGIAVGDLNGDGKPDLIAVNEGSGSASVFINHGDGTFASAVNITVGPSPRSAAIADINGDGKLDAVIVNAGNNTITVLPGQGDGTFGTAQNYPTAGSDPYQVLVSDVNADSKLDVLVANYGSSQVSVFLNKGNGAFEAVQSFRVNGNPISITTGDFNADSRIDIASANYGGNSMSVLFGNRTEILAEDLVGNGVRSGAARGNIAANTDVDYWKFSGKAGDLFTLAAETPGFPSNSGLYYRVDRPDGSLLVDFYADNNGSGQSHLLTLPVSGTYLIHVQQNYSYTGEYRFRVTTVSPPLQMESEANDNLTQATPITFTTDSTGQRASVAGYIRQNSDLDYFNLGTLAAGNTVFLNTRLLAGSQLVPVVSIYDASNGYMVEAGSGRPFDSVAEVNITQSGVYYALVRGGQATGGLMDQYILDIQVLPTGSVSFPNLQVISIDPPPETNIRSGQSITASFTVKNVGSIATPVSTWTDRVVLSQNAILGDADDVPLGVFTHNGALNPGQSYLTAQSVRLPDGIQGSFYLIVQTDSGNAVPEFVLEGDNVTVSDPFQVALADYPDLKVENLQALGPDASHMITVEWTTANRGRATAPAGFKERLLVKDALTGTVIVNSERAVSTDLAPAATLAESASFAIPGMGTYNIFITTDSRDEIFEYDAVSHASAEQNTATVTVQVANTLPSISVIPDQTIQENTAAGPLPFNVSDLETPAQSLVLTANSSNTSLVPVANLIFGGSGTNRTISVAPAANQIGSATISVTVTDAAGGASTRSFLLNVVRTNHFPMAVIDHKNTSQNTALTFPASDLISNDFTGSQPGLKGTYFAGTDLTNLRLTRVDPNINFDWSNTTPDPTVSYPYSVRWTGQLRAKFSETYTISTVSDDGVRLWFNGDLVINNWTGHGATEDTATVTLHAGSTYDIVLEYFEDFGGGAIIQLAWTSPSQPKEIIPNAQLLYGFDELGQTLTLTLPSAATVHGGSVALANGQITYTPPSGFTGIDSFNYVITDNGTSNGSPDPLASTGLVAITVSALNTTPVISSFTPSTGLPGTEVTVTGQNFTGVTQVQFNGTSATSFTFVSDTSVKAIVPAAATTGKISLTTPAGTGSSTGDFTIQQTPPAGPIMTSFTPASGPPGTLVTLTGQGFTAASAVLFNSTPAASFTVVSDTSVTATVPAAAASGRIALTTSLGTATSSTDFTVVPPTSVIPSISSFTPVSGAQGAEIVITGQGFANATSVAFNGVPASRFTVVSDTSIHAFVPAAATTGKITVQNSAGSGISTASFTVLQPTSFTGAALDGYVANGLVFFDANFNRTKDTNEPATQTDSQGQFNLSFAIAPFDANQNGQLDPAEGTLVIQGGIDIATGLPLAHPLTAPPGSKVISPLTTLLTTLLRQDSTLTLAAAQSKLITLFGLGSSLDLTQYDPLAAARQNDPAAAAVLGANAKIQNTISILEGLFSASTSDISLAIETQLAADILQNAASSLSSATALQGFITRVAQRLSLTLSTDIINGASQIIAAINQKADQAVSSGQSLLQIATALAKGELISGSSIRLDLNKVAHGQLLIADAVAAHTGTALDQEIAAAIVGDVLGGDTRPGTFAFSQAQFRVIESGQPISAVTILRSNGNSGAVSLVLQLADGTAKLSDGDYSVSSVPVTFQDGQLVQTVPMTGVITDDNIPEPAETVLLTLVLANGAPSGAAIGTLSAATLTIEDNDHPPVANPDDVTTLQETPLTIAPSVLLANDTDPDFGDQLHLSAVSGTSAHGGTVVLTAGQVIYTPHAGFNGLDSFTYTVVDLLGHPATGNVTVHVNSPVQGFEADLSPRPNGSNDGKVTITDWVQVGRFAVGLDTVASATEFMRADCAPRLLNGTLSLGDGQLTIADWVQAGRYAAGLDPVTPAGGPSGPLGGLLLSIGPPLPPIRPTLKLESTSSRAVRLDHSIQGAMGVTTVYLHADGNENAVGFSLQFDPNLVLFDGTELTPETHSAGALLVNAKQADQGLVGIAFALPAGQTLAAGDRALLEIHWAARGSVLSAATLAFGDSPVHREVVDEFANLLPVQFASSDLKANAPGSPSLKPSVAVARTSLTVLILRVTALPSSTCVLESSTDLHHWSPVKTLSLNANAAELEVPRPPNGSQQFYRIRTAP